LEGICADWAGDVSFNLEPSGTPLVAVSGDRVTDCVQGPMACKLSESLGSIILSLRCWRSRRPVHVDPTVAHVSQSAASVMTLVTEIAADVSLTEGKCSNPRLFLEEGEFGSELMHWTLRSLSHPLSKPIVIKLAEEQYAHLTVTICRF
jgi:hypothetical protein